MKYLAENSIIDLAYVQEQIEMKKREEILLNHNYSVWFSEKENVWYTCLPDETKSDNRRRVKRRKKSDLEKVIVDYYLSSSKKEKEEVLTVEKLFYEFMKHKSKEVGSSTIKRMMIDWRKFYKPEINFINKVVKGLTKIDIDNFFNSVLNEHQIKKKGFYNMCGILKQMLEYAVDAEYIEKSPYRIKVNKKNFVSDKKSSTKEVYKTNERELLIREMERRLKNNPSNTAPLAVLLDFELGTRKGEILAISTNDIVEDRLHIHRQIIWDFDISDLDHVKSKGFRLVEYTKSEEGDRWLPLTQRAKEIISRVEQINRENGYNYKDLLFCRKGKCLSPSTIDSQIKRGCEFIGIPVKTMHKIRKTYASTLLHNGVNVSIVKDLLGHADETTTLKHYIFNIEEESETDNIVLNALERKQGIDNDSCEQCEQKIITFPDMKKAPKPLKIKDFRA